MQSNEDAKQATSLQSTETADETQSMYQFEAGDWKSRIIDGRATGAAVFYVRE